jgi:hypothetical protein
VLKVARKSGKEENFLEDEVIDGKILMEFIAKNKEGVDRI